MSAVRKTAVLASLVAGVGLALAGCSTQKELELPTESEVEGTYGSRADVRLNGNVVDVRVEQQRRQLRRGGELWARAGPYIYLFSPKTQELFRQYNGLAAVRVRTVTPDGEMIAQAMLRRDELTALTWPRAKRLLARAQKEGTKHPSYMADLVDYGEEHTEYEYNPRYVEG